MGFLNDEKISISKKYLKNRQNYMEKPRSNRIVKHTKFENGIGDDAICLYSSKKSFRTKTFKFPSVMSA